MVDLPPPPAAAAVDLKLNNRVKVKVHNQQRLVPLLGHAPIPTLTHPPTVLVSESKISTASGTGTGTANETTSSINSVHNTSIGEVTSWGGNVEPRRATKNMQIPNVDANLVNSYLHDEVVLKLWERLCHVRAAIAITRSQQPNCSSI